MKTTAVAGIQKRIGDTVQKLAAQAGNKGPK